MNTKILRKIKEHQGFALIATITLMTLLALLSIGLLTLAGSQVRVAQKAALYAEAQSLALLALDSSISTLQAELGADQRVTANSSILDASPETEAITGVANAHILGVWDSWDTWLNRVHQTRGMKIQDTYTQGRDKLFRRWLISDADPMQLTQLGGAKTHLGTYKQNDRSRVILLGAGTMGDMAERKDYVYAGKVQVDDAKDITGAVDKKAANTRKNIAWWVAGENQKARINLPRGNSRVGTDATSVLQATWDTPPPAIGAIPELSSLEQALPPPESEEYDRVMRKLVSLPSIALFAGRTGKEELGKVYHDVTLNSRGLLTDVKFGGLKKDMNLLFSRDMLPESFTSSTADLGLRPYTSEDGNATVMTRPIASWNQLYLWCNVWDSTLKTGQDESAAIHWNGKQPFTYVASDKDPEQSFMNNRHTYMRQPILLRYYTFVGVTYEKAGSRGTTNGGWVNISIATLPVFVWWNPYNVDIRFESSNKSPWGSYWGAHRTIPLCEAFTGFSSDPNNANNILNEKEISPFYYLAQGGWTETGNRGFSEYGTSFRKSVKFASDTEVTKGDASVIKAGEIVIFALPPSDSTKPDHNNRFLSPPLIMKQQYLDFAVDSLPMQEGWEADESGASDRQIAPYSAYSFSGIPYDRMKGGGNALGTYKHRIGMAPELNTTYINCTPHSYVLAKKYTALSNNKLGAFVMAAGNLDNNMIGKYPGGTKPSGSTYRGLADITTFTKLSPAVLNLEWGATAVPLFEDIEYPTTHWEEVADGAVEVPPNITRANGGTGNTKNRKPMSDFLAYYGVSAKWGLNPKIGVFPQGEDYRAKTWQHSSPLFWGSQMPKSSALGKTYSPYQFEMKTVKAEAVNPLTVGNILSVTRSSKLTPFGGESAEQATRIIAAELPLTPPASIAGFAGCRLTPGWYSSGGGTPDVIAKRFAYQSGVPGVGLGNSFADPMIPASSIFCANPIAGDVELGDFWDHGFMANDGVWDSWFASSLSARPTTVGETNKEALATVLSTAFTVDTNNPRVHLANKRFQPSLNGAAKDDIVQELSEEDGYKKASQYLTVEGAFNLNSTSINAWKATLHGLKTRKLLCSLDGKMQVLTPDNDMAYFSRFGVASSPDSHVDDYGSAGITGGIPVGEALMWSDLRKVETTKLNQLAERMVAEVKKRGPFLNMAEFINRRLAADEMGVKGALQAAIDKAGLNAEFESLSEMMINPKVSYAHQTAAQGPVHTAAPGYLIQSDVLAVLGNILTVRDDTFTIRAYGEVTDKSGRRVLARAWCEAVVQRGIDYVSGIDTPETPVTELNMQTGELQASALNNVNKVFGRKINVVSFRWLAPEEV